MDNDFKLYLDNARESFMQQIEMDKPSIPMQFRTKIENFVIAYDQAVVAINQTLWTPITGEASLPTDNKALCLFVEFSKGGAIVQSYLNILEEAKTFKSFSLKNRFTHYTILTKLKQ